MSRLAAVAAATFVALALPAAAPAQPAAGPLPVVETPEQPKATGSQRQLLRLVAPVALYPDPVLTDVLAAATYPTQVVEAQRFIADPANASLQGDALTAAAAGHDWDPSVVALLAFPQILQMMDARLEWTEQLGHAFVAQQADIMSAIQTLRLQAQAAGTLSNGPQDTVVNDGGDIAITPPSQQLVYLPAYDPACVYGPAPDCTTDQAYVGWGDAVFLPYGFTQWGLLDWEQRDIRLGRSGFAEMGQRTAASDRIWRHPSPTLFGGYSHGASGVRYNNALPAYRSPALTGATRRTQAQVHAPALRAAMPAPILRGGQIGRR